MSTTTHHPEPDPPIPPAALAAAVFIEHRPAVSTAELVARMRAQAATRPVLRDVKPTDLIRILGEG